MKITFRKFACLGTCLSTFPRRGNPKLNGNLVADATRVSALQVDVASPVLSWTKMQPSNVINWSSWTSEDQPSTVMFSKPLGVGG